MRILDSKDEGDRAVIADAPLLHEHLNPASRDFFARVKDGLARLDIASRLSHAWFGVSTTTRIPRSSSSPRL